LRISNRRRQRRRRELLAHGGAVLRAARIVAVVADVVSALVVDLAAALVLRVAGAAFRAGVGLKSFVIVEALAVVLLEPSCLAPLTAEASAL
jgi:predicted ABC-type sugar transport system permease subunit